MEHLTELVEQLKKDIATAVAEKLRPLLSQSEVPAETELDPFRLYTVAEAADILGLDRATMYEIPEAELPRCNVGPARGATRWMGADLLAYARGASQATFIQRAASHWRQEGEKKGSVGTPARGARSAPRAGVSARLGRLARRRPDVENARRATTRRAPDYFPN